MLIVTCGPIASGKSTLARAVARLFVRQGTEAAAIDLDLVYELLDPEAPKGNVATWRRARRAAAAFDGRVVGGRRCARSHRKRGEGTLAEVTALVGEAAQAGGAG
jgi:molybdopterin-guanine dinucleotide biosynthesis protein